MSSRRSVLKGTAAGFLWLDPAAVPANFAQDRMINPDLLRFMAGRIGARTLEVRSSHASPASHPHQVARLVLAAATARAG
jgi:hypothetical protein